ncbi:MAG: PHB depolymerase family esterase, partial [Myxococcales bacterium]|nr:PHB depolymerase family esterase [Myxococcales bacterium]
MQHRRLLRSLGPTLALLATLPSCDASDQERLDDVVDRAALSGWIYTPTTAGTIGQGRSLLVVLHGCAQTYGDLQNYGSWIDTAEDLGMVVSLPAVPNGGVLFGCWDYYGASHSRQSGHAGALLDHVEALLADPSLDIDPDQVYIAGLSSGGGMAMVMGCLAPDVFAGVGIAAGPTVGTSSFEISSVSTTLQEGTATCEGLAGAAAGRFDTQLAATISGTSDYTVAQGYSTLNANIFASLYADAAGAPSLSTSSLAVASLPGYQPAGTGTRYQDAEGSRVLRISATGMGHAWPAGSGPGPEIGFVATQGVDFARVLGELFTDNNRRVTGGGGTDGGGTDGGGTDGGGTDGGDTDGGGTDGGGTDGGGSDGGGSDGGGSDGGGSDGGGSCDPWTQAVSATITGHFSRFAVYPGGYGVADTTYLVLFYTYG